MKREKRTNWGEGRLLAAALCLVVAFSLGMVWSRRPRSETVVPAHAVLQNLYPLPLDLNAATAEELAKLPGIGEELALRILEYREANGGFASVEELDAVAGIGAVKIENLRDMVSVE